MKKQVDSNARRYYRLAEDNSIAAGQRFQRLVEACEDDGFISRGEASILVQEHNRMQKESRQHLVALLKKHGQIRHGHGNVAEGIHRGHTLWVDGGVNIADEPADKYKAWVDNQSDTGGDYIAVSRPKPGLFDSYLDMVDAVASVVISPGKKTTFFMIIGFAILLIWLARYYGFY